ncbi:hypothetical protein WGV25_08760, partial [Campylobacter jejuni]
RRYDEAVDRITALSQALQARIGRAEAADVGTPARLIGLDRLLAFAEDYRSALSGMARLSGGRPVPARSFRFHR